MARMMTLSIGNKIHSNRAYTFLELMVTVSVLSIGIVGIYRALLTSMDFQGELSHRLYAISVLEDEIAFLENQYRSTGDIPATENGKVIEAVLDHRAVPFTLALSTGSLQNFDGFLSLEVAVTWPDRGRDITLKRYTYLANLNIKLAADAAPVPQP